MTARPSTPQHAVVEALADLFMDLRLDGPTAEGWTYQDTARHYARIILDRWLAGIRTTAHPADASGGGEAEPTCRDCGLTREQIDWGWHSAPYEGQFAATPPAPTPASEDGLIAAAMTLFDPMDHGSPSKPNAGHTPESFCAACVRVRAKRTQAIRRALVALGAMPSVSFRVATPPAPTPASEDELPSPEDAER